MTDPDRDRPVKTGSAATSGASSLASSSRAASDEVSAASSASVAALHPQSAEARDRPSFSVDVTPEGGLRINPHFRFYLERAIVIELLERFSEADVDGIILSESQALTIACAAVSRVENPCHLVPSPNT